MQSSCHRRRGRAARVQDYPDLCIWQLFSWLSNAFMHWFQRVEFPMPSNDHSFQFANRQWELLEEDFHKHLFDFDKVCNMDELFSLNVFQSCWSNHLRNSVFMVIEMLILCCAVSDYISRHIAQSSFFQYLSNNQLYNLRYLEYL